ncbi:hypothetical protein F2Q69_00020399 [Brassica cretica]|uniref:Uncharacterized protein n=1 Tax=Brassica cretica TaxID=69181 RepID=A0A8S9MUV1_BRACR|nr:hypothetical protein F2Q69_00053462 [Brassica cretica]KAF3540972.1 hypothetical protein F2Q69_00020399 [Brassica cretica]
MSYRCFGRARSLRSDRASARARSLRSDRADKRYVATELRLKLGRYVATESTERALGRYGAPARAQSLRSSCSSSVATWRPSFDSSSVAT